MTTVTTTTRAIDETSGQIVLPGQTAAPDGPIDLTVMFVMHHAFRRDLAALAAAAAVTPVEDRATWRALQQRWTLFAGILHHHHSGEDGGLWPLLLESVDAAGDADGRAVLEAMSAEHAGIDPLLEACAEDFARLAQVADDDARATLAVTLAAARDHLADHLRHEETEALVLVQRHLTMEQWRQMEEEHFKADMPTREVLRIVGWVLHGLPPHVLERLRSEPSTRPMILLGRLWLSRSFARGDRRAMRYVTER